MKGSAHLQEAELVPLRDGTHLMATVLLPDDVSQASKRPAIHPLHPVPTHGGGCCTPEVARDQTEIEKRQDVLIYTRAPLAKPLDIAGYIRVTLHVSTSVPDTDIARKAP